ncbi:RNA polymerase recycling motor HelD [Alkaliphilus hydrothermalis]|uniref:DNA 3'-5' helicase n=1 Tax=Alkaliphilus hydrothermalis TaxID=1482730 RepID=A0ABS2NN81_9FIRM|nr:RNA polymerase recycling motor HelD [Alkaliphilus hydrothermalis]MBM7614400.1 DNA helicase-2/ATP-dependent DNA helicase PcrA [Alkaliphilus hydrothermalis]
MSVKEHPDYGEEIERLEYTKDYIKMTLRATEERKKTFQENIKEGIANIDSSEGYINILINSKFMETAERNFYGLTRAKEKPYFARIDFKPSDSEIMDKIYIGKTSLFRADDDVPLIVDWRAPIANVYYEGRLGETSYPTEVGVEEGELSLKRQYTIDEGELESILDVDITTTDTFLQASLSANADNRLKDIAATIQGEQNRVIRAEMDRPLIVQGVAGSGKTTIALHRIAYFIYTYEKTFDPENFMIMAPNNLFINYISEVLPELGVEQVVQTTYTDFMKELVGSSFKLTNAKDKLTDLIQGSSKENKELSLMAWAAAYKGSMDMRDVIDAYVKDIEKQFYPKEDFVLGDILLVTKERIKEMFLEELTYLPLYKRIDEIKKTLRNQLKYRKNDILKDIQTNYDSKIDRIRSTQEATEERRLKLVALMEERDQVLESTKKTIKTVIKKYTAKFPSKKLMDYYQDLMTVEETLRYYSNNSLMKEQYKYLVNLNRLLLAKKNIEMEDLASVAYLRHKIFGFDTKLDIKNIVIDEAQDFSLFQFYVLKEVLKTNMFTLLGDLSQGIHSYRSIQNWEEVIEIVFDKNRCNYMTLVQSYRTTIEVMHLANEIIKKLDNDKIVLAKPVIRHGEKPSIKRYKEESDLIVNLVEKIKEMKYQGYKSIALICKTLEEASVLKKVLDQHQLDVRFLDGKEDKYSAGIMLVPSHIAKGLEFDVVFIVNINETYQQNDLDIKLLYVAMTRTLHRLFIYQKEGTIPLLEGVKQSLYQE